MSDPTDRNRKRDLKIAENEASRERTSSVRVSTWAVGIVAVLALIALAIFLKR